MAERDGIKDFDTYARGAEWKGMSKYDTWAQFETKVKVKK